MLYHDARKNVYQVYMRDHTCVPPALVQISRALFISDIVVILLMQCSWRYLQTWRLLLHACLEYSYVMDND